MKLSTKSTYGLRAMLNIALNSKAGAVSVMDIARSEGISMLYLEQLLNKLRRSGLVDSVRGPKGGYRLSKSPREVTVRDIVITLEGSISPVHCAASRTSCKMGKNCVPKIVWEKLAEAIDGCLESITLKDLCAEAKKIGRPD